MSASDHPRACGANAARLTPRRFPSGSSPRMRGKLVPNRNALSARRIIPAHAGQTSRRTRLLRLVSDHPRACGANLDLRRTEQHQFGSSPRMRGKRTPAMPPSCSMRIIPAHAGQTTISQTVTPSWTDHPRACGANAYAEALPKATTGSSPRMRGKLARDHAGDVAARIIPAHAGQTVRFYAKTLERWTLNNWIRTVAPIFVLLFLPPVIGQNAYIERHYSNQSFSWFSKLHYASAFDLSLVA